MRDWCTFFPDYIYGVYIGDVCKRHDIRYENKRINKWQADILLYREIKRKGLPITAIVMWIGVTLFGWISYALASTDNING